MDLQNMFLIFFTQYHHTKYHQWIFVAGNYGIHLFVSFQECEMGLNDWHPLVLYHFIALALTPEYSLSCNIFYSIVMRLRQCLDETQ